MSKYELHLQLKFSSEPFQKLLPFPATETFTLQLKRELKALTFIDCRSSNKFESFVVGSELANKMKAKLN